MLDQDCDCITAAAAAAAAMSQLSQSLGVPTHLVLMAPQVCFRPTQPCFGCCVAGTFALQGIITALHCCSPLLRHTDPTESESLTGQDYLY